MPDAPDLKFAIGLPPERAIAYFQAKGYAITFDWREMLGQAHDRAFTVAKAMDMDILADIRQAVDRALAEGWTTRRFIDHLEPTLRAKGWWGRREIVDPRTGEVKTAQLGSPWRLRNILETNLTTAYAAGRYREQLENADLRPFWRYVAVMDAKTRPMHRVLHNKVFRYDDPFWKRFYPPIDWGCRCRVESYSARGLKALGLEVEDSADTLVTEKIDLGSGFSGTRAVYTDPATGGRVATGVGWDTVPGGEPWQPNLDQYPGELASAYVKVSLTGPDFRHFFEGQDSARREFPVAILPEEYRARVNATTQTVLMSDETLAKNKREHPDMPLAVYQQLPDVLENAQLVILEGDRFLVFIRRDGELYHAVVKATQTGQGLYLTSYRLTGEADAARIKRRGVVLKDEL